MRSENPLTHSLTCLTGPMTIGVPIYTELPSRVKNKKSRQSCDWQDFFLRASRWT